MVDDNGQSTTRKTRPRSKQSNPRLNSRRKDKPRTLAQTATSERCKRSKVKGQNRRRQTSKPGLPKHGELGLYDQTKPTCRVCGLKPTWLTVCTLILAGDIEQDFRYTHSKPKTLCCRALYCRHCITAVSICSKAEHSTNRLGVFSGPNPT
jgi:hypothetical protein